jgi:hypothetical protein
LLMADDWIERDLDNHAAKGLAGHQNPSRSTWVNSSASSTFLCALAV